jgi:ribose 5-phosphate isomerase B
MSTASRPVVAVAADHAGVDLKRRIVEHLRGRGDVEVRDLGPETGERVDYPDFAGKVARSIGAGDATLGVLVCGTGVGMAIAANKYPGIRAAVVSDHFSAGMARAHNDAQILCLGARVVGEGAAFDLVDAFLDTPFEGGRHAGRVAKIHEVEKR